MAIYPSLMYRFLYGDGIQSAPGNPEKTISQTISATLSAGIGTHWTLGYNINWNIYSSDAFRDSVGQAANINWNNQYQDWTFSASYSYSFSDTPLIETGGQTEETTHTANINALYAFGKQYALETDLRQTLRFTEAYNDPREWSIREMLHRNTTSIFGYALGAEYGYTQVQSAPDTATLQLLGSVTCRLNSQVNLSVEAGLEKRRIYSEPAGNMQNPVYSASVQYAPVTTTSLGFSASRATSVSYLNGQISDTIQYGFSFQQRLLTHLQLTASVNHQESTYSAANASAEVGRIDKSDSFNLGLGTTLLKRLSTSVFYQYSHNKSNETGFGFSSEQIGFELGYSF